MVPKDAPHKMIKPRSVLNEKNYPELDTGELITLDAETEESVSAAMMEQSKEGLVIGSIVFGFAVLMALAVLGDSDFTAPLREGMTAAAAAGFAIVLFMFLFILGCSLITILKTLAFRKAVQNGEKRIHRFEVTGKYDSKSVVKGAGGKHRNYYVIFGGVRCFVKSDEHCDVTAGDSVYCAVIAFNGKEYFCYLGKEL